MKYILRIATAVLLATSHGHCLAVADGPDHYSITGVSAGDALSIHAEPDVKATRIGEIPSNGNCVRNLGCRGGLSLQEFMTLSKADQQRRQKDNPRWCEIEYQGTKGWVAGHHLAEGSCVPRDEETQENAASRPATGSADAK